MQRGMDRDDMIDEVLESPDWVDVDEFDDDSLGSVLVLFENEDENQFSNDFAV